MLANFVYGYKGVFSDIEPKQLSKKKIKIIQKQEWCSTKTVNVNARCGPGQQYPVVYKIIPKCIPLLIVAAYDGWNLIIDADGEYAWIHSSLLSGVRYAICICDTVIRKGIDMRSKQIASIKKNVIVRIKKLQDASCYVEVCHGNKTYYGYVDKDALFGTDHDLDRYSTDIAKYY